MRLIEDLTGSRTGAKAVIVGGGMSASSFDFWGWDGDIIALNDSLCYEDGYRISPDYLVYSDGSFTRVLQKLPVPAKTLVIANANSPHPRANYRFDANTLFVWARQKGYFKPRECNRDDWNVGLRGLLIAKLLGYSEIYLTGYDFYSVKIGGIECSHHQGDRIGTMGKYPDMQAFKHHIGRLKEFIKQFDTIEPMDGVWNCNPRSLLNRFPHKVPAKTGVQHVSA